MASLVPNYGSDDENSSYTDSDDNATTSAALVF